jgi:hypothetical protein
MIWFDRWGISLCIEDPLKTWRKVKKLFKKPHFKIHFFSNPIYNCPHMNLNTIAKIIDIESSDVGWKEKYGSSRHERSPYIWVCLFKRIGFSVNWHVYYRDEFDKEQDGDMFYWEYLLNYLYFNKSLKDIPVWTSRSKLYKQLEDDSDKYESLLLPVPIVAMSLNKDGIKELKILV